MHLFLVCFLWSGPDVAMDGQQQNQWANDPMQRLVYLIHLMIAPCWSTSIVDSQKSKIKTKSTSVPAQYFGKSRHSIFNKAIWLLSMPSTRMVVEKEVTSYKKILSSTFDPDRSLIKNHFIDSCAEHICVLSANFLNWTPCYKDHKE